MKSIAFSQYGTSADLDIHELVKPTPAKNEVLVKIRAVGINDWDWGLLRGQPFINRVLFGLNRPKKVKTLGFDIAGVVEAKGDEVSKFQIGDEVFGDLSGSGWGGFAEYVAVDHKSLLSKPSGISFQQAAAIPQPGALAMQGLLDFRKIKAGDQVLINGGGGGTGTLAIQIASELGAAVTAVDKESKLDLMKSLGADHVIDFTKTDFTSNEDAYDLILDLAGHHPLLHYKKALKSGGIYLMVGGSSGLMIKSFLFCSMLSFFSDKALKVLPLETNKHLSALANMIREQKVLPVIDAEFPLSEAPQALQYFGSGNCLGKIILTIE